MPVIDKGGYRPTQAPANMTPPGQRFSQGDFAMHPSVDHILQHFEYKHLPPHLQEVSKPCAKLAQHAVKNLPHNHELTAGLRKLLEAKDCFVSAWLVK